MLFYVFPVNILYRPIKQQYFTPPFGGPLWWNQMWKAYQSRMQRCTFLGCFVPFLAMVTLQWKPVLVPTKPVETSHCLWFECRSISFLKQVEVSAPDLHVNRLRRMSLVTPKRNNCGCQESGYRHSQLFRVGCMGLFSEAAISSQVLNERERDALSFLCPCKSCL